MPSGVGSWFMPVVTSPTALNQGVSYANQTSVCPPAIQVVDVVGYTAMGVSRESYATSPYPNGGEKSFSRFGSTC